MSKKSVTPLVSVLMLNWNGFSYTRSCIRSLLLSEYPNIEIIVFDNGSSSNEFEKLQKIFHTEKRVKCFSSPENLGYAQGMNEAFKKSSGTYVMISNNDMKYDKKCLSELVDVLSKNKSIGLCQPKLRHLGAERKFDYSLAAGGYVDIFGYPFARGRIFTHIESDHHQYDTLAKISWCGIFMAKREVIKRVGFFNNIYFNYGEDMDFCFRVYSYGYTIVIAPQALAYHVSGGVLKKNMLKKMYFHHRNNIILMIVNWPLKYLLVIFPVRLFMDFLTVFYYLSVNFSVGSHGILKAYVSIFLNIHQILYERKKTMKNAKHMLFNRVPFYKGSVAFDYFILKRNTFSKLRPSKTIMNMEMD